MNTIDNSNAHSVIEEEAGAWVIKLDGESDMTTEQRQAFKEWMGRSPAHRDAVKKLAQFWGKMNVLTELAVPQQPDNIEAPSSRQKGMPWFTAAGITAMASVCLLVTVIWLQGDNSGQANNGLYATAIGQQKTIQLKDGSELQLNTNTQVEINYSDAYRDIYLLQGEAHFVVAKNKNRPFRVSAGKGVVRALGTAFSVYLNQDDIEVILTEGRVALAARPSSGPPINSTALAEAKPEQVLAELSAGQRAVIKDVSSGDDNERPLKATIKAVSQRDMQRSLSWRKGFVTFKGTPLDEVVAEVGRYSQMSIELTDPSMAAIQIGGQFRIGEVDAILASLEQNFGLKVVRVAYNHVQISNATSE